MQDLHKFISQVTEYCERSGVSPATLCNYAANNARLFDRLKKRAEKTDEDVRKITEYMKNNPVGDK